VLLNLQSHRIHWRWPSS